MTQDYDIAIIGAGAAGLTAALYCGRAGMKTALIEGAGAGGQIVQTAAIENYPGCLPAESGASLMERFRAQALRFGAELIDDTVFQTDISGQTKTLTGQRGLYRASAVILASGASPAHLGCPGEEEHIGSGVSYCATCDGPFFEGLPIYVVGGGDSAVEEAVYLTRFSRPVTLIHRRSELRAAKSIQEKAFACQDLRFLWDSAVRSIEGDSAVETITVENLKTGERQTLSAGESGRMGLFIFAGLSPNSAVYPDAIRDEHGYIKTDEEMQTAIPGVFAAGDIRSKSLRQVITAASDGAVAAVNASKYCERLS